MQNELILNLPRVFFEAVGANFSPRPNHFKRQNNTTKRPTTEKNTVHLAIQAVISSCKSKKITVGKREMPHPTV